MVDFSEIPANNKSPLAAAEFDPIGAPGTRTHTILAIGTRLATGTVAALVQQLVTGRTEGDGFYGAGSQMARMLRAIKSVNTSSEVLAIAVDEPVAGAKSAGTLTITGPATADGALAIYIGGDRVPVGVTNGDSATTIAAAIAAAINATAQLPVTAASALGVVTCTCKWKGLDGDDISLATNLRTTDKTPAGVGVAIVAMAGGAGVPDLSTVVAALEERIYDSIACGIGDATAVVDLTDEVRRRWKAGIMLDGHVFMAARGNLAALTTLGTSKNDEELTIMGAGTSPTPAWIWCAQTAALEGTIDDPGLPRFGLQLVDVLPPPTSDRWDQDERNLLLGDGISTHRVDAGGNVIVDRLVTTYETNALGGSDDTWEALTTRRTAAFLRQNWVARIKAKYSKKKLADDGTQVDPGVPLVTPSTFVGEALAWYREMMAAGHVENFEKFRANLAASRPADDTTRVDMLQALNITNELVTVATKFAFSI